MTNLIGTLMKKFIILLLIIFCSSPCFATTKEITIENANHKFDDYFKVKNLTSEIVFIEISVRRKETSPEQKVGSALVPPNSTAKINTVIDGQFDEYDYIKAQTSGSIYDYSVRQKNSDVILTINSYSGPENDILLEAGSKFKNEVLFDISNKKYQDYVFIQNKTDLPIYCLLYGIVKDSEKEIYIGKGIIDPKVKMKVETFYDDNLQDLKAIRLRTDVKVLDSESICSSHDMNITIYAAEEDIKQEFTPNLGNDDKNDLLYILSMYASRDLSRVHKRHL